MLSQERFVKRLNNVNIENTFCNISTDYLVCPAYIPGHAVNLYFKPPFRLAAMDSNVF